MSDTTKAVKDFIENVNKTYKGGVVEVGGNFGALSLARFSSGILSLDCALGGGWPFGRIGIIAGMESTGKTLEAIKAMVEVQKYDHDTKMHKDFVDDDKFTPGTALFVDVEGSFDVEWAKANGFDDSHHIVARPEYSEQAIDIVTTAVEEGVFDLIIIDSLAALAPTKELEASSEEWQMGLAARLINKAMRKWVGKINKASTHRGTAPLLLCLNQFRINIGQFMGDPRTLPGGKGQLFAASIILYTKSPDYQDSKDKELAKVKLAGTVQKNKTYVPKVNFTYALHLKDEEGAKKGDIDNLKQMQALGKKYGLIVVDGGKVSFGDHVFKTQKALMEEVASDPTLFRSMWRSIVKASVGKII